MSQQSSNGLIEMLMRSAAYQIVPPIETNQGQFEQLRQLEKTKELEQFEQFEQLESKESKEPKEPKEFELEKIQEDEDFDDTEGPVILRKSPAVVATNDEILERAVKFYAIGMAHLDQQENYSAMLNLAMAACTLIDYRSLASRFGRPEPMNQTEFGESVTVRLDMCEYNPKSTKQNSQQQAANQCSLNSAIKIIVSKIEVLKSNIVEIRSGLVSGASATAAAAPNGGSAGSGGDEAVVIDDSIVVRWDSKSCQRNCFARIIGQEPAKNRIKDSFISSLLYPNLYGAASKGLLMYGPPGTGKTTIARAIGAEIMHESKGAVRVVMLTPQGQDLKSKYHGEGERKIKAIFDMANKLACEQQAQAADEYDEYDEGQTKAKKVRSIGIIFIDEIDAIASSRTDSASESAADKNTVTALLQQMDGFKSHKNIAVIAATNDPWKLDTAIRRRLETSILIDLPTAQDIEDQLSLLISQLITDVVSIKDLDAGCAVVSESSGGSNVGSSCSSADYSVCVNTAERDAWVKYKDVYFSALAQTPEVLTVAAKILAQKKYSAADVNIFFRTCMRENAKRAIKSGVFITGPIIKGLSSSDRAYVSVPGIVSEQPWTPIAPLRDKILDVENADPSDPEIGAIVNIPPEETTAIDYVLLNGKKYRNIFAKNMSGQHEFVQLAFVPYCIDPIVNEIFIQVQDENPDAQVTDPTKAGVLFRISLPMQQGPLKQKPAADVNCQINGSSYESDSSDQIGLLQRIISDSPDTEIRLENFYCINRKDAAHLFVHTTVDALNKMLMKQAGAFKKAVYGLGSAAWWTVKLPFSVTSSVWGYIAGNKKIELNEDEQKQAKLKQQMDEYKKITKEIDKTSGAKMIDNLLNDNGYSNLYTTIGGLNLFRVKISGSADPNADIIDAGHVDGISDRLIAKHQATDSENKRNIGRYNNAPQNLAEYIRGSAAYHTIITSAPMYSVTGHPLYLPETLGDSITFEPVENSKLVLQLLSDTNAQKKIESLQYDLAENLRFVNWGIWPDIFTSVANAAPVSGSFKQKEYDSVKAYGKS